MTSPTKIAGVRIARSLKPAEQAMNEAALRMLSLGQAIITPRADGTVHPLEGDVAVRLVGENIVRIFDTLAGFRAIHTELRALGVHHDIVSEGVFDTPPESTPRGASEAIVATSAAVAA